MVRWPKRQTGERDGTNKHVQRRSRETRTTTKRKADKCKTGKNYKTEKTAKRKTAEANGTAIS